MACGAGLCSLAGVLAMAHSEEDTESHLFQQLHKLIDLDDRLKLVGNV